MSAQPGNKNAVGNRGGGRLGYLYERDQLNKLRRIVDRMLNRIEAIEQNKFTPEEMRKQLELFDRFLPVAMKAMDKLHANKQAFELPVGEDGQTSLMEMTLILRAIAAPKQLNVVSTQSADGIRAEPKSLSPGQDIVQK